MIAARSLQLRLGSRCYRCVDSPLQGHVPELSGSTVGVAANSSIPPQWDVEQAGRRALNAFGCLRFVGSPFCSTHSYLPRRLRTARRMQSAISSSRCIVRLMHASSMHACQNAAHAVAMRAASRRTREITGAHRATAKSRRLHTPGSNASRDGFGGSGRAAGRSVHLLRNGENDQSKQSCRFRDFG